jgi:hypothetical protein
MKRTTSGIVALLLFLGYPNGSMPGSEPLALHGADGPRFISGVYSQGAQGGPE